MPDNLVVDASVVVKWFHEELDTRLAEKFQESIARGKTRAIVPVLLFYEVANVLTLKAGSQINEIIAANQVLRSLPFQVVPAIDGLLDGAIEIAHQHKISVYDAIYLAVANAHDIILVTADEKLAETTKLSNIKLLSTF